VRGVALGHALQALDRATRLTDELLALARLDHDTEAPLSATPGWQAQLDLAALVQDRVAAVAVPALARGLEVSLQVSDDAAPVAGHPDWIAMAVDNLLSNALKYTPAGGQVRVAVASVERGMAVVVHDTGPGVRPEDLAISTGDDFLFEGNVEIVEALGEVTLLYVKGPVEDEPVVVKLPGIVDITDCP